jgi:hypothetical protein
MITKPIIKQIVAIGGGGFSMVPENLIHKL